MVAFDIGLENPLSTSKGDRPHQNVAHLFKYPIKKIGVWQCDIPDDQPGQNYLRVAILAEEFDPDLVKIMEDVNLIESCSEGYESRHIAACADYYKIKDLNGDPDQPDNFAEFVFPGTPVEEDVPTIDPTVPVVPIMTPVVTASNLLYNLDPFSTRIFDATNRLRRNP